MSRATDSAFWYALPFTSFEFTTSWRDSTLRLADFRVTRPFGELRRSGLRIKKQPGLSIVSYGKPRVGSGLGKAGHS